TGSAQSIIRTFAGGAGAAQRKLGSQGGTSTAVTFTVNSFTAPSLTGIMPASSAWGARAPVTLTGLSFLSGMNINVGPDIAVSDIPVATPSLATATFAVSSSAPSGGHAVTASTGLGLSNSMTFTVNPPQLSVVKSGTGNGTVTSSPEGIQCGTNCTTS